MSDDTRTPLEAQISRHLHAPENPIQLFAWHGTTHDISRLSLAHASHESHFGQALYFTTHRLDAALNYAHPEGLDLQRKVEDLAARIEEDLEDDPAWEDTPSTDRAREAEMRARAQIVGPVRHLHRVHLTLHRPFLSGTRYDPPLLPEIEDAHAAAIAEVAGHHGLDPTRPDAVEESHEEDVQEACDIRIRDAVDRIETAYATACAELDCIGAPDLISSLPGGVFDLTHRSFERLFREDPFVFVDTADGHLVNASLMSRTLARLGFDSIILGDARGTFHGMTIPEGTAHIHILPDATPCMRPLSREALPPIGPGPDLDEAA